MPSGLSLDHSVPNESQPRMSANVLANREIVAEAAPEIDSIPMTETPDTTTPGVAVSESMVTTPPADTHIAESVPVVSSYERLRVTFSPF